MTLRLEETDAVVSDGGRVALEVLGFRNDLARHRTIELLGDRFPGTEALSTPFVAVRDIDRQGGEALQAELSALGAFVRVTPIGESGGSEALADTGAADGDANVAGDAIAPSIPYEVVRSDGIRLSWRSVRVMVLLACGAFLITRQLRDDSEIQVVREHPAVENARRQARARMQERRAKANPQPKKAGALRPSERRKISRWIEKGEWGRARDALDAVAAGESAEVLALRGTLHFREGDWAASRSAYERAIELSSGDPEVFLGLASIYRMQGLQEEAVDMLHRAQLAGAKGREFEQLKRQVIAEQDAESKFGSTSSSHFTVSFDEGEDDGIARLVLSHLEDAYVRVGHMLGHYPEHATPVALYAARDFQAATHSPSWAGALYDGRIKLPVRGVNDATPDLARTVRHEYAHAIIVSLGGGRCPVWLNEGVAMWAEEDLGGRDEESAAALVRLGSWRKLRDLERSFLRLSPQQAVVAYAQSYLAVRFIVARYGERMLQDLLVAFAEHATSEEAFRAVLSTELSAFEEELRRTYAAG